MNIFKSRRLNFHSISKINNKTQIDQLSDRGSEIKEWINSFGKNENFVIIDDDSSIHRLPDLIKNRWVCTKPSIGFDNIARLKALEILTIQK
jgi:hypothetical protein